MKSSYLILDEYMRFLDKGNGEEKSIDSILNDGIQKVLEDIRLDEKTFKERKGDCLFNLNENYLYNENCDLAKVLILKFIFI